MWVQSLGREDPLEKGMSTHSSILTWGIPMDRGAWQATIHGVNVSITCTALLMTKHLSASASASASLHLHYYVFLLFRTMVPTYHILNEYLLN